MREKLKKTKFFQGLTSTTTLPFSPCKHKWTVNAYTHFPSSLSFHIISVQPLRMWCPKWAQRGSVDSTEAFTATSCQLSNKILFREKMSSLSNYTTGNHYRQSKKTKILLTSNFSESFTFCVVFASFFLMLKMTWKRSFRSTTSGSACGGEN